MSVDICIGKRKCNKLCRLLHFLFWYNQKIRDYTWKLRIIPYPVQTDYKLEIDSKQPVGYAESNCSAGLCICCADREKVIQECKNPIAKGDFNQ